MLDIDPSQLPTEISNLLLTRGEVLPPLHWPSCANRNAAAMLDELSDAKLFGRSRIANEAMAGAVRALLYLWNGWPNECSTVAQAAPPTERSYLDALCARQTGDAARAKSLLQQVGAHPIYGPMATHGIRILAGTPDPLLVRFRQMLEVSEAWEPFLFTDLYDQGRTGKLKAQTEQDVRQLQCWEFELLFRHCCEAATGQSMPRSAGHRSVSAREENLVRMRDLAKKHQTKRAPRDGAPANKAKSAPPTVAPQAGSTIAVACPKCHSTLGLPGSARGNVVHCSKCATAFRVPDKTAPPRPPDATSQGGVPASTSPASTVAVQCPKCGNVLVIPESARGNAQKCTKCGAMVFIPLRRPTGTPSPATAP